MADSPGSSDLSDPPSVDSDQEEQLSTVGPSSRPSADITPADAEHLAPPPKRRKTGPSSLVTFDRALDLTEPIDDDDEPDLSSDGYSSAPGSPTHDEYSLREEAQTQCLWRECEYGEALNNDELVKHVQSTHCASGGPKKVKYVCEWGECQKKNSNHPSGYALKAHMRSHTKEKPYYCALPECDKAFTRSDALAKHMRTVHEPEQPRNNAVQDLLPPGKKAIKIKLTNGSSKLAPTPSDHPAPAADEEGNLIDPSPPNDNITYIPAHHPITGQPGFMIHYPPDIHFNAWESSIPADQLMRLLRRQLHWAQKQSEELRKECDELEKMKKEEWVLKEILLDGVLEAELATAGRDGLQTKLDKHVVELMEADVEPAKHLSWTGGPPEWRQLASRPQRDVPMDDVETPPPPEPAEHTPSPPRTGKSGGFDGDNDPYDNYLAERMAEYEERERQRSLHNTPQKVRAEQQAAEADAVGALLGMSGSGSKS